LIVGWSGATGRTDHVANDYHWSSENTGQSGAVRDEMFFPLPASAARYFKGGSLRVLFDEWS